MDSEQNQKVFGLKEMSSKPNEIVKFFEGTWTARDITIFPSKDVKITEYKEIMQIKDPETIAITAIGIDNGRDVKRDMTISLKGDKVTLSQRGFSAEGTKKGNLVSLKGTHQKQTFIFRLYLMQDKYIYQKDVWKNKRVVESQMSYLLRSTS